MVLERAREGLGRDLDNLSEEARLLREAREELARCKMLSNTATNQMPLISGSKMNELPGLRRWRLWRLISNCLVSLLDRGRLRFRQLNIGLSLGEEAGSS